MSQEIPNAISASDSSQNTRLDCGKLFSKKTKNISIAMRHVIITTPHVTNILFLASLFLVGFGFFFVNRNIEKHARVIKNRDADRKWIKAFPVDS